jgi:nucleotide-binding universal stress UspA family protein
MEIRRILLVLTSGRPSEPAARLAARLAREHGATVEGLCLYREPETEIADSFAIGPQGVGEVLEHRKAKIDAVTANAEAAFRGALTEKGLSEGWTTGEIDAWSDGAIRRARLADLVIISEPGQHAAERRLTEDLVLRSGTPCLMTPAAPASTQAFDRVVLAWNGSAQAKRALDDGLAFMQRAAAVAVVVAEEEATGWVGKVETGGLIQLLARHGVQAELVRIDARGHDVGPALLGACRDFSAKLLVMGAFSHSRASETILGGVTKEILARPATPTLLSH